MSKTAMACWIALGVTVVGYLVGYLMPGTSVASWANFVGVIGLLALGVCIAVHKIKMFKKKGQMGGTKPS